MSITVREWIEKFNNGEFDSKDIKTQCVAGWIDWHCAEEELPGRLKAMGNIIKNIKDDYILDNFKVDFKNNCPVYSPLFDYFRFTPIKKGKEAIDSNIVNKLTFGVLSLQLPVTFLRLFRLLLCTSGRTYRLYLAYCFRFRVPFLQINR